MHDAEMLLGLHRHLVAYSVVPATSALGELQLAGKILEVAFRLRGSGVSSIKRVEAIAVSSGVPALELKMMLLPVLDALQWVRINRDTNGEPTSVEDIVPPVPQLLASTDKILDVVSANSVQRAALTLLRLSSLHPLERLDALHECTKQAIADEDAEAALRHLVGVNLLREVDAADGRSAIFNPNIWSNDAEATAAALKMQDARISGPIGALMEEIRQTPGIPQELIQSDPRWIDFAVSQGLIQRTVVSTDAGDERKFLFTPHLHRDAFGNEVGDASGHVRQLVGSMIYAMTYPNYKLTDPAAFVRRLINDGQAGDASPIGTDYPMLETAGIVQVIPGSRTGRFSLKLLQSDVAESALKVLQSRQSISSRSGSASGIFGQRGYRHLESERASLQLAKTEPIDSEDNAALVAALRQASRSTRG